MIKPYTSDFFEKYLKFESDTYKEIHSLNKNDMKLKDFILVFKKLNSIRKKKPISYSVIKTFYEQPKKFFSDYHSKLENTTFFDYAGNSIFCHLFYVLYVDYKRRNNLGVLNENEKNLNFEVYESKFESFLKEYERYFLLQDVVLDTPLHKIAKRKDKGFFIELYQKLKKINLISNELLLTNNVFNETICTYVLNEIKNNLPKIKNEEFYYNFINEHHSIYESFSKEDQKILKNFSSKVIFEIKQYREENFNEIFNNLNHFINNNIKTTNLFEYIYFPFTTNINYLNCVFSICSKDEDYNKLFNLVSLLSEKKEIIDKIYISELCIVDHIKHVIRKMGLYNRKSEQVYNYGVKLIKEILFNIMKSKDEKGIKKLIGHKRFKKGLLSNIIYNQSLSFDKKIELLDLLKEITKGISNKYIEKNTYNLYRFFKLFENIEITHYTINDILAKNLYAYKILQMNKNFKSIIFTDINGRDLDMVSKNESYINKRIKSYIEFLNKNYYNSFKYAYNLSDEYVEKILKAIYVSDESNDYDINNFFFLSYEHVKKVVKSFILSDKDILEYCISPNNRWAEKNFSFLFEYLFSSEFDLNHLFINYDFDYFIRYLKGFQFGEKNCNLDYSLIKGKPFEDKYLALSLIISGIVQKIDLLLPFGEKDFKNKVLLNFNIFYKRHLFEFWNLPFDYIELSKTINKYILPFSKLFIKKKDLFKGIINEITSNLDLEVYFRAMEIAIDECEYYKIPEIALNHELSDDIVNELYLTLIFIYIKKKFEDQIPNLTVFLLIHLLKTDYPKFINLFEDSFRQGNINNILNYIYFTEPCYSDEKHNIVNYLKKNNNSFCKILKNFNGIYYLNYENYMKFIYPYLRGYAFYDDNHNNKNIPYHKYTDFKDYFESLKYHKNIYEIHIRALAYYDFRKRSNDNEEDNVNFNYICTKLSDYDHYFLDILKEPCIEINKYLYKKFISFIDYMSKETINRDFEIEDSKEEYVNDDVVSEIYRDNKEKEPHCTYDKYNEKRNLFFDQLNLYELFICIKEEKKNFMIF